MTVLSECSSRCWLISSDNKTAMTVLQEAPPSTIENGHGVEEDHNVSDAEEDLEPNGKEGVNGGGRSGKRSSRYPFQDVVDE